MNARKYLLATVASAAIAAIGLASAGPASACEAGGRHHPAANADEAAFDIMSAPADLPKVLGQRGPQTMRVDQETAEATGKLQNGASNNYRIPAKKNP